MMEPRTADWSGTTPHTKQPKPANIYLLIISYGSEGGSFLSGSGSGKIAWNRTIVYQNLHTPSLDSTSLYLNGCSCPVYVANCAILILRDGCEEPLAVYSDHLQNLTISILFLYTSKYLPNALLNISFMYFMQRAVVHILL